MSEAKLSKKEIQKIANLSKLNLSEEELKKYTKELNEIVQYMNLLNEVDTEGVEPLFNIHGHKTLVVADDPLDPIKIESLQKIFPKSLDGYIKIPQVVKKEKK